jgi:photosystem II stability/assembly factor-like uncharacterized protein
MLPTSMALQGALNAAAPALFAASQHLVRLGASSSVLTRSTTVSSSSGLLARGISNTSAEDKKKWSSVKVKPGLRSFAAQPALDETAMFCFQASWATRKIFVIVMAPMMVASS